jgi:putative ABC transport system permease protein
MNVVSRGIRNAFRNSVRTLSIVIILGLSIGLSLTMLIAHQAVTNKINSVKSSIGNTVTIAPAGFSSFSQVNNSLTTSELNKVKVLPNVTNVSESLTDRLTKIGSTQPSFGGQSASNNSGTTSLTSPITFNFNGSGGSNGGGGHFFVQGGGQLPTNFSPPITVIGTNNPSSVDGSTITISSGKLIGGNDNANDALVSTTMASKNNLKVGSTFTAYSTTITVAGIFTSSTQSANGTLVLSLPTEQRLSNQSGDVTSAVATVNSLDNLNAATSAIKNTLGSSADVTSSVAAANATVAPLNSVKSVSLYSLIGAVLAGGVIILLTMVMIVRERKREIGVIKAIGGSNITIMFQFMAEALTLTVLGAVIGLAIGIVGGNPVTSTLINNSTASTTTSTSNSSATPGRGGFASRGGGSGFGGGFSRTFGGQSSTVKGIKDIHAEIGWSILVYGLGAAVLIALIGSATAAGLIAKVRPSEVMRAD